MRQKWFAKVGQIQMLFARVDGNARIIVITEGISAVPFQWYMTYLTLYMLALGVSEIQVGLFSGVLVAAQVVSTFLGGYAADRFGRKWVLVVFDILCWGVPMILYAIARNPWYFLAGRMLNGFVYIVSPAFDCLFVEEVPAENRPAVFSMFQFLTAAASLLAPVAGWMVLRWGMIPAGRVIMGTTAVVMIAIPVARWFTLRETEISRSRKAAVMAQPFLAVMREQFSAVGGVLRSQRLRAFLLVRTLLSFSGLMWGTYAVIYLADPKGIGLDQSLVALLPFVSSIATIALIFIAAERMHAGAIFQNLIAGQLVWLLSALCFIFSPRGTIWLALLSMVLLAVSTALSLPASSSYWANLIGDSERAYVFSAASALMLLASLPAAPLAGFLYVLSPRLPFLAAVALQVLVLGLIWGMRFGKEPLSLQLDSI